MAMAATEAGPVGVRARGASIRCGGEPLRGAELLAKCLCREVPLLAKCL